MSNTILFFGSGPVAAESLRLLAQDFSIEAVVTKPRAPHHTGDVPVLTVAEEFGLPLLYATSSDEVNDLFNDASITSRGAVLIDFGIIVSQKVIDYFPLGIINSHFSVLPEWRGADPISFAILCGQAKTGVSLMLLVAAMDEGPLLSYDELDIAPTTTTPELTQSLIKLSHKLLSENLPDWLAGKAKPVPQTVTGRQPSYSRKLTKADGVIDWQKPAEQLAREVRAYAGWPRSRTSLGSTEVIITAAHAIAGDETPGNLRIEQRQLGVYTGDGLLIIDRLIPAGKNEMDASAFLAGYQIGS